MSFFGTLLLGYQSPKSKHLRGSKSSRSSLAPFGLVFGTPSPSRGPQGLSSAAAFRLADRSQAAAAEDPGAASVLTEAAQADLIRPAGCSRRNLGCFRLLNGRLRWGGGDVPG